MSRPWPSRQPRRSRSWCRGREGETELLAEAEEQEAEREERDRRVAEHDERRHRWHRLSRVEREHLALGLLGDERLTVADLHHRFGDQHPDKIIHENDVRAVLRRLLAAREVDRKAEPRVQGGKAVRFRYFRRAELEGPIARLEVVFTGSEGPGG